MNKKDLKNWNIIMVVSLFIFVAAIIYFVYVGKWDVRFTIFLGTFLGVFYSLLDYHFKEAKLSLDMKNKEKVKQGFSFKKIQRVIMVAILILAALLSFAFELINFKNVSIEKPSIIFILFFSIKEIYEYILDANKVISDSKTEFCKVKKNNYKK